MVGLVHLDGDRLRGVPPHRPDVLRDGYLEGSLRATVEEAVPEQGDRPPGDVDRVMEHGRPLHELVRPAVAPEEGVVPRPRGFVDSP